MTRNLIAGALLALAGSASAQTELLVYVAPDRATAVLGETVTWTVMAELLNPDPNKTILAVVSDFGFDLSFGSETGIDISNNWFRPAFVSDFFGPPDPGDVVGNQIIDALGVNVLPPLNNPGGPDSSNPLAIYSFDTLITDGTPREVSAFVTLNGQISGAYTGSPFPDVFFYQNADGSPGTVPFRGPNLLEMPFLEIVIPAPASASLLVIGLLGASRCRR